MKLHSVFSRLIILLICCVLFSLISCSFPFNSGKNEMNSQSSQSAHISADLPQPIHNPDMTKRSKFDPRVRQYILPKRVLWHTEYASAAVENPESLLMDRTGQVTLDAHNPCVLRSTEDKPAILLDFGRELHGGVQKDASLILEYTWTILFS